MAETVSMGIIGCGSVMQHASVPLLVNEIARGHEPPAPMSAQDFGPRHLIHDRVHEDAQ